MKASTIKRLAEGDDLFFSLKFTLNILRRLRKIDRKVKQNSIQNEYET